MVPGEPALPEALAPEGLAAPRARPGAYWISLVVLAAGLAIVATATWAYLDRPDRPAGHPAGPHRHRPGSGSAAAPAGARCAPSAPSCCGGRGRPPGAVAVLLNPAVIATASQPVPAGASRAELRADMLAGQLRIDPEAPGLYAAELRGPGRPTTQVTTADDLAVLDLRAPAQRGAGPQPRQRLADPAQHLPGLAGRRRRARSPPT